MGRERTNNAAWLRLTALVALIAGCYGRGYYGVKIGKLTELAHAVKGEVFAVDSRTIHIRGFSYDGTAPDAFFYAGTSGQPSDRGYIIPDEKGTQNVLGAYRNKHITLTLPDGQTLKDIAWISVWCRAFTINFGHVMIPIGFDYPRPQKIDAFPTFEHGVSSDRIVVVDAQTFLIPNFSYDGQAPDAHFWVGKGAGPGPTGNMVPDENGAELPLKKYTSKTIVITLPADQTVFDIDHLSVWCQAFFADFGHVRIPKNLNIPPSLKMLGVAPQSPGYLYSAPSSRPSFSHKPKSASYKPTTPKPTTYRPTPTTTRRYKAKAPRPTYKPTTTRRPYKPRTTTPKPYRLPTTTPRPYRPTTTTRKPYRPTTTTRKPYRRPTTTPRPYRPPTTTPRYKAPKPTYRPTTPRTPYKPTTPRDIYNPFTYRPPQTSYRPTTTPRPYYRPSTTPYYSPPSSSYRPVSHHTPYRHPSATNRDPYGHFGHFGINKAIEFPRESEEHSSSSSKSSKRHKTASTHVTKEVASAPSSSEEETRYRSEEETRSHHPRKSQSSSSSSKSRSRSHSSSPSLSHFQAASHFTAASHFAAPNHRFSHSKGRSDEDSSSSSERSLRFPYHQSSSESSEREPDSDRRYTRSHNGEKRSNEGEISKSYSSVSINMKGGSMSHFINH